MENYNINNLIKYVICLIILCFVLLANSGQVSQYILSNLKNEIIPLADTSKTNNKTLIEEFVPSYGASRHYDISIKDGGYSSDDQEWTDTTINVEDNNIAEDCTNDKTELSISTNLNASIEPSCDNSIDSNDNTTEENIVEVVSINNNLENVGINYSMEQLENFEFLISNCYIVDGSTSITSNDINIENMLETDLSIDLSDEEYKVLIYHTHGSEAFLDSRPGVIEDTIIGVGDELERLLEENYGINTYHDRTVYDVIDGKLDRNNAYTQSGHGVDQILAEYPSIEVILDVHRDGVRDEVHLMKVIDGKPTAQIMFFNGISRLNDEGNLGYLHNPNLSSNLSFSLQMHLKGKALYGDLMRKIYIGGYCYNLDRRPRASLIEVGAQNNTVEEAKNAMIPLAAILYSVLSGN